MDSFSSLLDFIHCITGLEIPRDGIYPFPNLFPCTYDLIPFPFYSILKSSMKDFPSLQYRLPKFAHVILYYIKVQKHTYYERDDYTMTECYKTAPTLRLSLLTCRLFGLECPFQL